MRSTRDHRVHNGNRWRKAAPGACRAWRIVRGGGRYRAAMRVSMLGLLLSAMLATLVAGCADAGDAERLRGQAEELTDRARFCLAVTRAVTAVESGSPDTAREAAEEVLAQAPDELATEARTVVEELRRVLADGDPDLRDPDLRAAADQLRERSAQLCASA